MAITKSAKKAVRQSARRKEQNLVYKNKIKALVKEVNTLISTKKAKEAQNLLPKLYTALDKAAKRGVIKSNNASRRKSRFAKAIAKISK